MYLLLLLLAALMAAPLHAQTVVPELVVETVTTGLGGATTMGFVAPDDILVLQKNGRVRRVVSGVLLPQDVLVVPVNTTSERGLLGIAVNSESPPKVFLYYTEADVPGGTPLGNRVYRYDWNPVSGLLENPVLVLDLPVLPGANHNGGILALGPPGEIPAGPGDGAVLYAIIGDLNRDGQLQNFEAGPAPDDTSVILRVDQDGQPAPGNPFTPYCSVTTTTTCGSDLDCPGGEVCNTQVARYYAYGIRNSFGMALDPVTGEVWDTENGPNVNDEINLVAAGMNSGWQDVMGPAPVLPLPGGFEMPGAGDTYSDPEFTWADTNAPTSILFPDGSELGPSFDESALVADNNAGQLYEFPLNASRDGFDFSAVPELQDLVADDNTERDLLAIGEGFGSITDLKLGPDGFVYVVSIDNGAIYRLPEPAAAAGLAAGSALLGLLASRRRAA